MHSVVYISFNENMEYEKNRSERLKDWALAVVR